MTKTSRFKTKPATPMNQWVQDALVHYGKPMTVVAEAMNRAGLSTYYDRSKIQKMTVARGVKLEEAQALSRITGYPLTDEDELNKFVTDYKDLDSGGKAMVQDLIQYLRSRSEASE